MLYFDFNNKTKFKLNKNLVQKINKVFFEKSGLKKDLEYSLAFVGETKMRSLNRVLRGKDKVTDVLSFEEDKDGFISGDAGTKNLGEIIICPSRAKSQARKYGWSFDKELTRLLIHGLSHLMGYDHEKVSVKKAQEMFDFEAKIMMALKGR